MPGPQDYDLVSQTPSNITICFNVTHRFAEGVWQVTNTMSFSLPLFVMELFVILFITRSFLLIGKYFHMPRFFAELIGGIICGPTALGHLTVFQDYVFTFRGNMVLETIANIGLCYYMFLVALEMDIAPFDRTGTKPLCIAFLGVVLPGSIGFGLLNLLHYIDRSEVGTNGSLFWAIPLTVTSFPDLAQVLSDSGLLQTDIGKLAIKSGIISDILAWFLLALALSTENPYFLPKVTLLVLPAFYVCVVQPGVSWLLSNTKDGQEYTDNQLSYVICGVALSAFVTEMCALQSIAGGLLFGLVMPKGEIRIKLKEKLECYVIDILLPMFYLLNGLMFNLNSMNENSTNFLVIVVLFFACFTKIVSTFIVSLILGISPREGFTLGVLMNTKGSLAILILYVGRNLNVLSNQNYTVMMLAVLLMTMLTRPLTKSYTNSLNLFTQYECRTLQTIKPDSELRILGCFHSAQDVPSLLGIMEASNPTKKSPIFLCALQLIELTGRASAMVIVRDLYKSSSTKKGQAKVDLDDVFNPFEKYERLENSVFIQPLTSVSSYKTMGQDVCNIANSKRVTLIIVPFHRKTAADGTFKDDDDDVSLSIKAVNMNVLEKAPCSVGIIIDRGLGSLIYTDSCHGVRRFAMFFLGGANDREALAYALRMGERPGISLTVVRFLPGNDKVDLETKALPDDNNYGMLDAKSNNDKEAQLDDEFINAFRFHIMSSQSTTFSTRVVNSGDETLATIRTMTHHYQLFIIGRGQEVKTAVTWGLSDSDWEESECPELGVLGNALVTSKFAKQISILVVQHYGYGHTSNSSIFNSDRIDEPFSYQRTNDDEDV